MTDSGHAQEKATRKGHKNFLGDQMFLIWEVIKQK
jgi:hypothetical protein